MIRCLTDESRHFHIGRFVRVDEAVTRRQCCVVHIQRLHVVGKDMWRNASRIEPAPTGVVVDLAPARNHRGTRDIAFRIVHERDHIGHVALGAAHRCHRRKIAVGEITGEIGAEILGRSAEQKARVGRGEGGRNGQRKNGNEQAAKFHADSGNAFSGSEEELYTGTSPIAAGPLTAARSISRLKKNSAISTSVIGTSEK